MNKKSILALAMMFFEQAFAVEGASHAQDLRLVGLIADQNQPIEKTIMVIRNSRDRRTYTIQGTQIIPEPIFGSCRSVETLLWSQMELRTTKSLSKRGDTCKMIW